MRTLSMSQPGASLLVAGCRTLETRCWQTSHRGPILIHAARSLPEYIRDQCCREPLRSRLRDAGITGPEQLPLGKVIGRADLVECILAEDMEDSMNLKRHFGELGPGQWIWRFANVKPLPQPIPARGRLGVFELAIDLTTPILRMERISCPAFQASV